MHGDYEDRFDEPLTENMIAGLRMLSGCTGAHGTMPGFPGHASSPYANFDTDECAKCGLDMDEYNAQSHFIDEGEYGFDDVPICKRCAAERLREAADKLDPPKGVR